MILRRYPTCALPRSGLRLPQLLVSVVRTPGARRVTLPDEDPAGERVFTRRVLVGQRGLTVEERVAQRSRLAAGTRAGREAGGAGRDGRGSHGDAAT